MSLPIDVDKRRLVDFCRKNNISKLAFFGSVLRENFRPDSDVDVLVEFLPDHEPGLIKMSAMERELSEILGRKADLRTPEDLSRYFREEVITGSEVQYAA